MADDQIRLCAHMMPVSDVDLSAVYHFALLPGFALLFLFLLIYDWFIYYAKPNPARIPSEIFI